MNDKDLTEQGLAATIKEALRLRDSSRAEGATAAELDAAMERTLRAAWPQTREWKYLCENCRDVGLEMLDCPGDATCGRTTAHLPHDFGRPCWCPKGRKFHNKPKVAADFPDEAGTSKRKPSRFGR